MNQLTTAKRVQVIRCLCEGMSIRATVRTTGASKNTIVKLLREIGAVCSAYQDDNLRQLGCMVVQCDEVWSFVGAKEKNATSSDQGDIWCWTAIDADSKLLITWHLGGRGESDCRDFIDDLADRLTKRIQLSTDGHGTYKNAVKLAFGKDVDYGQIIKVFGVDAEGAKRYSPAECTGCLTKAGIGDPLESQISTSYIERSNLTWRMHNRRMTRLTNGFSKSVENHAHAMALTIMYYNFARPHQTLTENSGVPGERTKTTPAMAAGVADHVWTIEEIIGLLGN